MFLVSVVSHSQTVFFSSFSGDEKKRKKAVWLHKTIVSVLFIDP